MENTLNLSKEQALQSYSCGQVSNFTLNEAQLNNFDVTVANGNTFTYPIYDYYNTYHYWYPCPTLTIPEKSKTEQAFKIVKVLISKKVVEIKTVKQFVDLIDEIITVL